MAPGRRSRKTPLGPHIYVKKCVVSVLCSKNEDNKDVFVCVNFCAPLLPVPFFLVAYKDLHLENNV